MNADADATRANTRRLSPVSKSGRAVLPALALRFSSSWMKQESRRASRPRHAFLAHNVLSSSTGWASDNKKELGAVGRLLKGFHATGLLVGELGDNTRCQAPGHER